jgi:DNA-binding XRE family transcriptional regulator
MQVSILSGADVAQARAQLRLSQAQMADMLGISVATLRRHESDVSVSRLVALAVQCILSDHSSDDNAGTLVHYQAITAAAAALYRATKQRRVSAVPAAPGGEPAPRSAGYQRMTPEQMSARRLQSQAFTRQAKIIARRNDLRAEQRPLIANIHAMLEGMQARGESREALIREIDRNLLTANDTTFVQDYLLLYKEVGLISKQDPAYALPDEPLPF